MPSRKSNVSTVSAGGNDDSVVETPTTHSKAAKDGVSIDDLTLPKSMIARLAKGVLPANTQIHKDALLALHKSATVFVSYIASTANELAQAGGKKTIAPQDVFNSIKDAELLDFVPRLEAELKKYNEMQCDKRNSYRHRVKQEKAAAVAPADETTISNGDAMDLDGDRPQKKLKGDDGVAVVPDEGPNDEELLDAQLNPEDPADDEDDVEDDIEDEQDDPDEESEDEEIVEQTLTREPIEDEALDEHDSD